MSQRTQRGIIQKDQALEKLRAGRHGAIQVQTQAKIASPEYRAAGAVMDAIDELAGALTGDKSHFHLKMATAQQQSE